MLEGTAKDLLQLLKQLDQNPEITSYEVLVDSQRKTVTSAQAALAELLKLEGLCDATTLKTPSGRKRRRDRGQARQAKKPENRPATYQEVKDQDPLQYLEMNVRRVKREGDSFVAVDDVENGDDPTVPPIIPENITGSLAPVPTKTVRRIPSPATAGSGSSGSSTADPASAGLETLNTRQP